MKDSLKKLLTEQVTWPEFLYYLGLSAIVAAAVMDL
jgi:hypothetical protein